MTSVKEELRQIIMKARDELSTIEAAEAEDRNAGLMVQVEFVGCSPEYRDGEYGWKPVQHAFIEVYVDGKRFRIDIGNFHDGKAKRRGLHIFTDAGVKYEQTSMGSVSLFLQPTGEHPETLEPREGRS